MQNKVVHSLYLPMWKASVICYLHLRRCYIYHGETVLLAHASESFLISVLCLDTIISNLDSCVFIKIPLYMNSYGVSVRGGVLEIPLSLFFSLSNISLSSSD